MRGLRRFDRFAGVALCLALAPAEQAAAQSANSPPPLPPLPPMNLPPPLPLPPPAPPAQPAAPGSGDAARPAQDPILSLRDDPDARIRSELFGINFQLAHAVGQFDFAAAGTLAGEGRRLAARLSGETRESINLLVNIAGLRQALGEYGEAETLLLDALARSDRLLGAADRSHNQIVNNLGMLYAAVGRSAEAEARLAESLEGDLAYGQLRRFAINLGLHYMSQERFAEAEALMHDLPLPGISIEPENAVRRLNILAMATLEQGRLDEAADYFAEAVRLGDASLGPEHPDVIATRNNLAFLQQRQGRLTDAAATLQAVLEASRQVLPEDHPNTAIAALNLAEVLRQQGRTQDAAQLYSTALPALTRSWGPSHFQTIVWQFRRAFNDLESPASSGEALAPARLAVDGLRARRQSFGRDTFAEAQANRDRVQATTIFATLADAAWTSETAPASRTELVPEVLLALQDAAAGSADLALVRSAVRHLADEARQGLGALVREREDLQARGEALSRAIVEFNTRQQVGDEAERRESVRARLHAERESIDARLAEIDTRMRRDFPDYFALVRPEPIPLRDVQAMLQPGEAVLLVVPTEFGTHTVGIGPNAVAWQRSAWTSREIDEAVRGIRASIETTMAGRDYRFDRSSAHALYREIVAPVAPQLAGARHVYVMAAGALTSIPFEILVSRAPEGSDEDEAALRGTRWLGDDHALVHLPSLQSLAVLRRISARSPRSGGRSGFLGFGDPLLRGEAVVRGRGPSPLLPSTVRSAAATGASPLADVTALARLSRLPGTAAELEAIRRTLAAPAGALFLAERATERNFRRVNLEGIDVLVVATHGLLAGEAGVSAEPGLVLTPPALATEEDDGFLTASEVAALRLNAEWVILSACNTAAGDGTPGARGLSGLARAFFHAGARSLLVSHWPVADEVAPRLTSRTIELLNEQPELSRAEAFRLAMQEVRSDQAHPEWAHPGAWAPFSLVGDARR